MTSEQKQNEKDLAACNDVKEAAENEAEKKNRDDEAERRRREAVCSITDLFDDFIHLYAPVSMILQISCGYLWSDDLEMDWY